MRLDTFKFPRSSITIGGKNLKFSGQEDKWLLTGNNQKINVQIHQQVKTSQLAQNQHNYDLKIFYMSETVRDLPVIGPINTPSSPQPERRTEKETNIIIIILEQQGLVGLFDCFKLF